MNDFDPNAPRKTAPLSRGLAAKRENVEDGRHLAAREQLGIDALLGCEHDSRSGTVRRNAIAKTSPASMSISPRRIQDQEKAECFRRRAAAAESNRAIFER